MANPFLNDTLKVAVAQICQTIGFQGIFSTPADVLRDVLHRYLTEVCRVTHRYSEHFGRTEPNLDDLGLAFQDLGVNVTDLEEYINNVDSPSFPHQVPSVPIRRASNLNFLKPGSREILSRPIHIHEHLPPMYPEKEDEVDVKLENDGSSNMEDGITPIESPLTPSKRPLESDNLSPLKKTKYFQEEEGQPVREILSVMMTTSGFISSAREGKLPEAAMPNIPMAPVRTTTPTINSPASGKKKLERIIRQKNSQGGSSSGGTGSKAGSSGSSGSGKKNNSSRAKNNPSGQGIKTPGSNSNKDKDGVVGGLNIPKAKPGSLPPSKALPPTLNPVGPVTPGTPQQMPPKLKIPPKIKVPKLSKTPKSEGKITPLTSVSTPKPKESSKDPEQKKVKKDKEKKNKDGKEKKDKEKKEKSGKEKSGKEKKEGKKKDKESKKIKKEKKVQDKEKAEEAERERELILKLASSAAVSITSIPPPTKILQADNSDKLEVKSKLSIFQKKKKHKGGDIEGDLDKDPNMSRDSSPDLMIDENPNHVGSSSGQWKLMDDEAPSFREAPIRRLDLPPDEPSSSPVDAKLHQFPDNLSPPGTPTTPRTPEIPHTTKNKNSEKRKNKDKTNKDKTNKDKTNKEKKKKDKTKSQKIVNFNSPSHQSASESETPDRPKTPEAGGVSQNDPSAAPFSLNPFPSAPGFIPPFSGFPLFGMGTFGAPSIRPPMPDLRLSSHSFVPSHHSTKRPLEEESVMDDIDNMDRPLTPRHDREASPLPLQVLTGDPGRSPQSSGLLSPSGSIPRPRTPVLMSPQPLMKQKPDKGEKSEKKKEHKKEKKEKDKDKVKKKKDKKDKDKDKDKVEKKKDKDKLKQEKKEKKKGKKDKGEAGSMKLTMKFSGGAPPVRSPPATSLPTQQQQKQEPQQQQQQQQLQQQQQQQQHHEVTPKLVIKPVIKHEEPPVPSIQPTTFDKQPGSPEIAKFSALITRPPKASKQPKVVEVQSVPALKIKELSAAKGSPSSKKEMKEASKAKEITSLKIKPLVQPPKMSSPKVANEKKSPSNKKGKEKKEKKEKKSKEVLGNFGEVSSVTVTPIAPAEIAVIAPAPTPTPTPTPKPTPTPAPAPAPNPPQKKETSHPSHPSHSSQQQQQPQQQQQQQSTGLLTETVGPIGHFVDDQGNEVWICPTCGKQDDGSPMIGCDTCDDWYHWVCVGIQVPPSEDSNWYCPRCLSQHKQKGAITDKKKRGRKKK